MLNDDWEAWQFTSHSKSRLYMLTRRQTAYAGVNDMHSFILYCLSSHSCKHCQSFCPCCEASVAFSRQNKMLLNSEKQRKVFSWDVSALETNLRSHFLCVYHEWNCLAAFFSSLFKFLLVLLRDFFFLIINLWNLIYSSLFNFCIVCNICVTLSSSWFSYLKRYREYDLMVYFTLSHIFAYTWVLYQTTFHFGIGLVLMLKFLIIVFYFSLPKVFSFHQSALQKK